MHATRWAQFRRRMSPRTLLYTTLTGTALGIALAAAGGRALFLAAGIAAPLALTAIYNWTRAEDEAEREFFNSLAPRLGLEYLVSGSLPPTTPLLSAGDRRGCSQVMEGPLFGALGGPRCTLAHYRFEVTHSGDEGRGHSMAHPFTVCGMELAEALPVFHGVYLRRRPNIRIPGFLWDDWLARAHADEVDLESTDFEELYELRVARDQDRLVLHQLFSPSFIVWLTEHPLHPGLECKAGMLVVFIPEHEGDADRLTLFHEAAREIARRVTSAVEAARDLTPAA
jgi:hypothetical protein